MPYYVWLIIAVLFITVEIFSVGLFYVCFAAGALAGMITGFITGSIVWQIVVFCVVSVALIPISRIFARRVTDDSVRQAGADALIGMTGMVTEAIRPTENVGKVTVDGQNWRADSSADIERGTKIRVTAVKGAKLIVNVLDNNGGKNG